MPLRKCAPSCIKEELGNWALIVGNSYKWILTLSFLPFFFFWFLVFLGGLGGGIKLTYILSMGQCHHHYKGGHFDTLLYLQA